MTHTIRYDKLDIPGLTETQRSVVMTAVISLEYNTFPATITRREALEIVGLVGWRVMYIPRKRLNQTNPEPDNMVFGFVPFKNDTDHGRLYLMRPMMEFAEVPPRPNPGGLDSITATLIRGLLAKAVAGVTDEPGDDRVNALCELFSQATGPDRDRLAALILQAHPDDQDMPAVVEELLEYGNRQSA